MWEKRRNFMETSWVYLQVPLDDRDPKDYWAIKGTWMWQLWDMALVRDRWHALKQP